MKAASIHELKQELVSLPPKKLAELCLRLARFKKENKELLTFLLFDAEDEKSYVDSIKLELDDAFAEVRTDNLYFAKKNLRKIVRTMNKYGRYLNQKESELEMVLHFCQKLKELGIPIHKNKLILNLYNQQLKKMQTLLADVHEDLQYDLRRQVEALSLT